MLLNNFFTITNKEQISDNETVTDIKINHKHEIFNGHFPNNPVVPGVVSVQMINEILSDHLNLKLMVSKAKNIKFANMINPKTNQILNFNIEYSTTEDNNYKVNAKIFFEHTIFLKFNGIFSII